MSRLQFFYNHSSEDGWEGGWLYLIYVSSITTIEHNGTVFLVNLKHLYRLTWPSGCESFIRD